MAGVLPFMMYTSYRYSHYVQVTDAMQKLGLDTSTGSAAASVGLSFDRFLEWWRKDLSIKARSLVGVYNYS